MKHDIRTVAWKEWRALADQLGLRRPMNVVFLMIVVGIMGTFLPWIAGPAFLASPLTLFLYPFLGASAASSPIMDSFAGERERKTLEALLSTPLADSEILVGKAGVGFVAGVVAPMVIYVITLVTINVRVWVDGGAELVLPPTWAGVGVVGGTIVSAGFVSSAGVVASMKSATVRQTAQLFGYVVFGMFITPVVMTVLLPDGAKRLALEWIQAREPLTLVLAGCAMLVVVDLVCMVWALRSFRRGRLALD